MKRGEQVLVFQIILLILILFLQIGCGVTFQLGRFKNKLEQGNFEWFPKQEISCNVSDEGCNQLHLIKGDACYRLAKQDIEPKRHFECASEHLDMGIKMTRQWQLEKISINRAQAYENLCESLRELQFKETGVKSEKYTDKLLQCAQDFKAAEPQHIAPKFFLYNAKFVKLTPCFNHPEQCRALCIDIKTIITDIEGGMPKADGTRYEPNYKELYKKFKQEQALAACP